jgi:hypothetical protein
VVRGPFRPAPGPDFPAGFPGRGAVFSGVCSCSGGPVLLGPCFLARAFGSVLLGPCVWACAFGPVFLGSVHWPGVAGRCCGPCSGARDRSRSRRLPLSPAASLRSPQSPSLPPSPFVFRGLPRIPRSPQAPAAPAVSPVSRSLPPGQACCQSVCQTNFLFALPWLRDRRRLRAGTPVSPRSPRLRLPCLPLGGHPGRRCHTGLSSLTAVIPGLTGDPLATPSPPLWQPMGPGSRLRLARGDGLRAGRRSGAGPAGSGFRPLSRRHILSGLSPTRYKSVC